MLLVSLLNAVEALYMKKKYKRNHELLDGKMKGVDPIQQLITLEVVAPGVSQAQSSLGTQTLQGQLGILPATGKKSQGIFFFDDGNAAAARWPPLLNLARAT